MVKIGVVDDNAGGMYLLGKLRQTLPCNYEFVLADKLTALEAKGQELDAYIYQKSYGGLKTHGVNA